MSKDKQTVRTPRDMETRDLEALRQQNLNFEFQEAGALDVPSDIKAYFEDLGYELKWARFLIDGQEDYQNILRHIRSFRGEFVTHNELPNGAIFDAEASNITSSRTPTDGVITVGDLALVKIPAGLVTSRRKMMDNNALAGMNNYNDKLRNNFIATGANSQTTKNYNVYRKGSFGKDSE